MPTAVQVANEALIELGQGPQAGPGRHGDAASGADSVQLTTDCWDCARSIGASRPVTRKGIYA
jgi:hypothetical protein